MKIVLTAGHGGKDPGAVANGKKEAEIACEMRNITALILKRDFGIEAVTDGTGSANLPLREALKLLKGADFALEFHCNASATATATGIECLSLPKYKAFCQGLAAKVAIQTGWGKRGEAGWKPDNAGQHARLAYAQAGGIVFEPFFITNPHDLAVYEAKKWLICRAVAEAIAEVVQ